MLNKSLKIKVPGKLMIAGEFAVLEPYQKLIVTAVDRFVHATITNSKENLLTLSDFNLQNMRWEYQYENIHIDTDDQRVNFVEQAMLTTCRYLEEQSISLDPFTLSVNSELDDQSGVKYGLGSSAAVVTAVVTAILSKHLDVQPSPMLIFKLASISHVKTQGNGSGADIAASTYGGILQYTSFQAEWLLDALRKTKNLTELVEKEWKFLQIKRLEFPKQLSICVGWTGKPASTANLVEKILELKEGNLDEFQQFLTNSKIAVETILSSIEQESIPGLLEGIQKNRICLADIGRVANVEIETPLLAELADIAEQFGGAGKLSGAGGGDCGLAFIPSEDKVDGLLKEWQRTGIKPLTIQSYPKGAEISPIGYM